MLRRLLAAVLGVMAAVGGQGSTSAQHRTPVELEILSKADALRLFGLTKQQWLQEVRAAVAAGSAMQTPTTSPFIGMSHRTPDGDLLTVRLDYSQGDARPSFIQVVVGYPPARAGIVTDRALQDAIAAAQRQMAPEFEVIGNADRIGGGVGLFFMILDRRR